MMVRDKLDLSWLKSTVREYMNFVRAQSDMVRHDACTALPVPRSDAAVGGAGRHGRRSGTRPSA